MIILRLFKNLRHPDTSLKSILNMAAAYVLIRNRQLKRRERVFRDRINPLDYMDDCDILEKFVCHDMLSLTYVMSLMII